MILDESRLPEIHQHFVSNFKILAPLFLDLAMVEEAINCFDNKLNIDECNVVKNVKIENLKNEIENIKKSAIEIDFNNNELLDRSIGAFIDFEINLSKFYEGIKK
jgi:hypothetical protein